MQTLGDAEQVLRMEFDDSWKLAENKQSEHLHQVMETVSSDAASFVFRRMFDAIYGLVADCAKDRLSGADSYLYRVATGSAAETGFLFALESITDFSVSMENCSMFTHKFEIFEFGRWPLCLHDREFAVY